MESVEYMTEPELSTGAREQGEQKKQERGMQDQMRLAVIGSPIAHSLSPDIHLPVLNQFAGKVSYSKVRVEKQELPGWVARVRQKRIDGFNVTMPLKTDILPLLDEIDEEACLFQSVNTVVNRCGKLLGYNTDGRGLVLSLKDKGFDLKDCRLLIAGAGAVARTIALKAAAEGAARIAVLGRTPEKALGICEEVHKYNAKIRTCHGSMEEKDRYAGTADIFINATPLGMTGAGADFKDFGFLRKLSLNALVCDLIYEPAETRLLAEARSLGIEGVNGLGMLIYQAILSDELYLNKKLNTAAMYQRVRSALEGKVDRL